MRQRESDVLSEGRNLDIFRNSPERMLEAAMVALEYAKIDPSFHGVVREDRVTFYESEVERWRRLCD